MILLFFAKEYSVFLEEFLLEFAFMPLLENAWWLTVQIWTSRLLCILHSLYSSHYSWYHGEQRNKINMPPSKEISNLVVEQKTPTIMQLLYWLPIES